MKRSQQYIASDISQMESFLKKRDPKYRRNFNRYYNNGPRSEDIYNIYGNVLSFYTQYDEVIGGVIPYLNILRSAVDTTVSKISQSKVKLFLNPVLGTYKTTKTVRNAQTYFDELYDKQRIHQKSVIAIRDALIFDMGVLWYDDEARNVERVGPWEFYFDPGEFVTGKMTRCMLARQQYPLIALESVLKKDKDSSYMQAMQNTPNAVCTYKIYYDLMNKMRYKYIGSTLIEEAKIEYDQPPFVWIYYNDPVKGVFSDSMIDVVYRIQKMIDDITYKITAAIELSPANTTYVPKGSDIKTSVLASSKTGDIFEYNLPSTGGSPVIVATPPVMDGQWIQLLELFEQKAYNLLGVSQLSAQAKKPSGLNSGVALQTMEDVESERHNVLVNNFIHFQKDIAERMIDIFPDDEDILPNRSGRANIKWRDVRKERELFNIQTSSGSSLSKDPKVKMEQIEKLIAMKIIAPELAASLLEFPDLEGAYSISTASYDCNEKIIERALEDGPDKETGQYHYYEVTNIQQLYAQTVNMLLRLDANDEKPDTLQNLVGLINQVKSMIDEIQAAVAPPMPPSPGPPPGPTPGPPPDMPAPGP